METTKPSDQKPYGRETPIQAVSADSGKPQLRVRRLTFDAKLPKYETSGAAAFDLRAVVEQPPFNPKIHSDPPRRELYIRPGDIVKIPTGLAFEIPAGYVGLISLRSSVGGRGFVQPNAPGVIDSDYRGEVNILLSSSCLQCVKHGERIAQLLIVPAPQFELVEALELSETVRGEGGFGSTGQ